MQKSFGKLWQLLAVVAAYVFVVFVLCPGTRFIASPVQHDDFNNLAHTEYMWYSLRPVSYAILLTLSQLGVSAYYLALHILIITYVFFSLSVLRRLLNISSVPFLILLPVAAAMLSHENTVEYSKYTGLLTNLLSGVFAMAAMSLMSASQTESMSRRRMAAILALAAMSFWSKEDFIVAVLLLAAYFAWQVRIADGPKEHGRSWLILFGGLFCEAVLLFIYNRLVQNGFTEASSGSYKPSFALLSIWNTAQIYAAITPGALATFLLACSAVIWNAIGRDRIPWTRVLAFLAVAGAMALPYLCLPNHVYAYYSLNWTVWEAGGGLLLLWRVWPQYKFAPLIFLLAAAALYVSQPGRHILSLWYSQLAGVNRNILQLLVENRARLKDYPAVAVEGAPEHGPWFGTDGSFLKNRLQMDHIWLIRVHQDSSYLQASLELLGSDIKGDVKTVAIESEPAAPEIPLVKLSPDGTGRVIYPAH
jgi:hypothetical protein